MTYLVELTEKAQIEVDRIYLWHSKRDLDLAHRWHEGFVTTLNSLTAMPGRCPIARENEDFSGITVRQRIYGKYRILFHVIEPQEPETEGLVRILHVLHGAQKPHQTVDEAEA